MHVEVEHNGGNEIDADFELFRLNDPSYVIPRCSVNWSKLDHIGGGDGDDNIACIGSFNSYGDFCVEPNSTYYIQVRGYYNGGLCGDQDDGTFRVRGQDLEQVAAEQRVDSLEHRADLTLLVEGDRDGR